MNLGLRWKIKVATHRSFIEGRTAAAIVGETEVGILGEIHPKVLAAWTLENPVAAFELNIQEITKIKRAL